MRPALLALIAASACKSTPPAPTGPVPALACDYVATLGSREQHTCTEVRDPAAADATRAWWSKIAGPRDQVRCEGASRCSQAGRVGGCVHPNGNIEWTYTGTADAAERACSPGVFVRGEAPPLPTSAAFRCVGHGLCQEHASVIDLLATVEAANCRTGGSTFEPGTCATTGAVGRCRTATAQATTTWTLYAPKTAAEVTTLCQQLEGSLEPALPE